MVKGLLVDRSSRVIVLDMVDCKVRLPQDAEDDSHSVAVVPCREKPDKNPNCESRKMMFKANHHFQLNMIQSQVRGQSIRVNRQSGSSLQETIKAHRSPGVEEYLSPKT